MKTTDLNVLRMAEAVIAVINLFIAKIGLAPKLQQLFDELKGMVALYHEKEQKLVLENNFAAIKQKKREHLEVAANKLISQMKLYAAMENDLLTGNKLSIYYADLYNSSGNKLVDLCAEISKIAEDLGVKLTAYNVVAGDVTGFKALTKEFSDLLSAPRMDIAARAAIRTDMENIVRTIRAHMNDKMDLSMSIIKDSELEFFNAYASARVIIDRKGKRNAKDPATETTGMISGTITDIENGEPIVDAIVQIEGIEEATTTDEDGVFIFDTVATGKANIMCTKELYKNFNFLDIEVLAGEETEVEGVMEKVS